MPFHPIFLKPLIKLTVTEGLKDRQTDEATYRDLSSTLSKNVSDYKPKKNA